MESNTPHTFVYSYEEGVERVLNGSYAFLGESTMLDYLVQRNCNLTQIGGLLDSKGYGIATPKGSRWRDPISQAILFLQEKGVIQVSKTLNSLSIFYFQGDSKFGLFLSCLLSEILYRNESVFYSSFEFCNKIFIGSK